MFIWKMCLLSFTLISFRYSSRLSHLVARVMDIVAVEYTNFRLLFILEHKHMWSHRVYLLRQSYLRETISLKDYGGIYTIEHVTKWNMNNQNCLHCHHLTIISIYARTNRHIISPHLLPQMRNFYFNSCECFCGRRTFNCREKKRTGIQCWSEPETSWFALIKYEVRALWLKWIFLEFSYRIISKWNIFLLSHTSLRMNEGLFLSHTHTHTILRLLNGNVNNCMVATHLMNNLDSF